MINYLIMTYTTTWMYTEFIRAIIDIYQFLFPINVHWPTFDWPIPVQPVQPFKYTGCNMNDFFYVNMNARL